MIKRIVRVALKFLPDKQYIQLQYYRKFGKLPDLKNPKTFNEKIQWLKLHDRKPEYTMMVDKYDVKKYIAEKIGKQYVIPTLGVWEKVEDIDWENLPMQFVLKCTHDSGSVVVCKDKNNFDKQDAAKKLDGYLKRNAFWIGREWPYKNVKPRIIAEKYLEERGHIVPEDYKVYCLNGKPKYIVVFHNRFNDSQPLSETVYDLNWQPQHISLDDHFAISDEVIPRPECLDELLEVCEKICYNYPQLRVDFYIIENKIYFGEITFHTASGFQPMIPKEVDSILGKEIKLPPI